MQSMITSVVYNLIDGKFADWIRGRPIEIPQHLSLGHSCSQALREVPAPYRCPHLPTSTYPARAVSKNQLMKALPYPKYYNTELLTL